MLKLLIAFSITVILTINTSNVYNISIPSSTADTIHLSSFEGKKILIVNTALNSQYTYQLLGLQQLYQTYQDSLVIVAIPSNSFGNEPNDDSSINSQLRNIFNIGFPVAAKTEVNGPDMNPLFQWLTQSSENGSINNIVLDDFTKYLIDESGHLIGIFKSSVEPMSDDLQDAIKGID